MCRKSKYVRNLFFVLGHAFGAGAFLALACDLRVMRPDKGWLNWPETPLGLRFGDPLLKLALYVHVYM